MTQDGPEAQTWTDFEEDCDAVNQARASKNQRQRIQRVPTCLRQESSTDGRCRFGMWRSRPRRGEPAADRRIGTGTVDDYETPCPTGKSSLGPQASMETSPAPAKHYKDELHVGQPLWFWRRGANAAKKPTNAFWHPGVAISNTLTTLWIAYRGSVVKCARSQVRPFHDDDEAADEHATGHIRDLGERLQHEGDFSYEDITGQDEPPVDSPPAPRENTATGPSGEGQMDVDPEARRRMRGKTRPISLEQSTRPPVNASLDAAPQEAERDHDDKRRRRIDEPVSPVSPVAQDEVNKE